MAAQSHEITIAQHKATGLHRALCVCGWVAFGRDLERLTERAHGHADEWRAIETQGLGNAGKFAVLA